MSEDDRRKAVRIQVNDEFAVVDGLLTEYVANLSRGGLFLRCDQSLPEGTEVELNFSVLLDDVERIKGRGVVVHMGHGGASGLGIRFTSLTPESQALLRRVCPGDPT